MIAGSDAWLAIS